MSLGEKTEAILRLFSKAGKTCNHPILIDQPENNLDNQAMSTRICKLLKSASEYRQIFVVTHSPNIAILSDADQIIKVSIDKSGGINQFHAESGSIENNTTCENYISVLEGGLGESFEKRAKGYNAIKNNFFMPPLGTTLRTESYSDVIQYGQKLKLMKVDLRELQLVA